MRVDLILKSAIAGVSPSAAKAWSSALTSLVTALLALMSAYVSGATDPSVMGAVHEALNNLVVVTLTTVVPAILSFYITYQTPNTPKE